MTAFYNEIDPYAANWLRNLIAAGHIAPGVVDQRSIEDIDPNELRHYTQCHFFAGIGVWSRALRLAGWPDDRPVWTGSCPCQPFSAAGKGEGFADERHLWPAFHYLISQCRPPVVFGEQVASRDGLEWLDLVQADLEGSGYASGAADLCAAGVGAPHIRQRLYWVGHAGHDDGTAWTSRGFQQPEAPISQLDGGAGVAVRLGHAERRAVAGSGQASGGGEFGGLGDTKLLRLGTSQREEVGGSEEQGSEIGLLQLEGSDSPLEHAATRPTNGHWRDADWLFCRDGKWRPVEPGTFPLAHGAAARVGRLRAYGNAIVPQVAQAFIEAYLGR